MFHSELTSALLITEPTEHPMTSVATIAAAAVPCDRKSEIIRILRKKILQLRGNYRTNFERMSLRKSETLGS